MTTLADSPVPATGPVHSVVPQVAQSTVDAIAAAGAPKLRNLDRDRIKDMLVNAYAYGLLSFGVFFPFVLAIWTLFFGPDAG